jgi:hypothetical protein
MCSGADQDRVHRRGLLQASGDVHGLAGGERRLSRVDDDLAGLDSDPHGEAKLLDGVEDPERGPDPSLGVVLVRLRDTERCHHGVPGELLDNAAVGDDAVRDLLEVLLHAAARHLRIRAREELCRPHEVDEQDCRKLALHASSVRTNGTAQKLPSRKAWLHRSGLPQPDTAREAGRRNEHEDPAGGEHVQKPVASG